MSTLPPLRPQETFFFLDASADEVLKHFGRRWPSTTSPFSRHAYAKQLSIRTLAMPLMDCEVFLVRFWPISGPQLTVTSPFSRYPSTWSYGIYPSREESMLGGSSHLTYGRCCRLLQQIHLKCESENSKFPSLLLLRSHLIFQSTQCAIPASGPILNVGHPKIFVPGLPSMKLWPFRHSSLPPLNLMRCLDFAQVLVL